MSNEAATRRDNALDFLDELDERHDYLLNELEQLNQRVDLVLNEYSKSRQSVAQANGIAVELPQQPPQEIPIASAGLDDASNSDFQAADSD